MPTLRPRRYTKRVRRSPYSYVCHEPGCAYTGATRFQLIRHTRFHTGERPYVCQEPGCVYATAESSHIARHTHTHHPKRVTFMEPLTYSSPSLRITVPRRHAFQEPLTTADTDGLHVLALAATQVS